MNKIHKRFSEKFRSSWIKIKFYRENPDGANVKLLSNVKFCEATKEAVLHPVILSQESINCPGAQYAFGWQDKSQLLDYCKDKTGLSKKILQSILTQTPRFKDPFEYIGLNTDGEPDLIMARLMPKEVMYLINLYHSKTGKHLDVSLSSMMSICGGIAVRAFLDNKITLSFGCMDSREYAQIGRDRLVVGVPKSQFDLVSLEAGK